jgi:acyl carrier protein
LITAASSVRDNLLAFINEYFVKETGIELKDDSSLLDEGLIDSTGVLELVAYLENSFEIKVEDEEIVPDNFDSLNKLVNFVRRKLENKS